MKCVPLCLAMSHVLWAKSLVAVQDGLQTSFYFQLTTSAYSEPMTCIIC